MNKQLTLLGIVTLNAAAVVSIIGCRSTSGMEAEPNRTAVTGGANGFSIEAGSSGFTPGGRTVTVSQATPPPAAVAAPTRAASPADEPLNAPGAEPVGQAPEPVAVTKTSRHVPEATPVVSDEPKAVGAGRSYVVKNNDSLWVISRREGVTINELAAANGIKANATLKPGQKLVIPAASGKKSVAHNAGASAGTAKAGAVAASGDTYTVVSGDAISTVAKKLHTTTAALRAANPQVKNDNIRVGQKLNVPNGSKAPAAAATKPAAAGKTAPSTGVAPAAKPAAGGFDLPEIAPLGGAPAPGAAPASSVAPEAVPSSGAAPAAVEATPVSR